jgi:hypothetical protein
MFSCVEYLNARYELWFMLERGIISWIDYQHQSHILTSMV